MNALLYPTFVFEKKIDMKRILTFICGIALLSPVTKAQTPFELTGNTYFQDFGTSNTTTSFQGWSFHSGATATSIGTTETVLPNGAWTATGSFRNVASTVGLTVSSNSTSQSDHPDRIIAVRPTGAFGDPGASFMFTIANTLNMIGFELSLKHLILDAQPRVSQYYIQYSTDGTTWTSIGSFLTSGSWGATTESYSFGNALDNKSTNVFIRIVSLAQSTESGNRDTYGIDDFELTWSDMVPCTAAPNFTTQPADQTVNEGQTVTFTSTATGANSYQWQLNDGSGWTNIVGATAASYTTAAATLSMSGYAYRVNAFCDAFNTTSDEVTLTVNCNPVNITAQPTDVSAYENANATFSVAASGSEPLSYQWQINTGSGYADIAGATTNSYTESNVTLAMSGYAYKVVVNNGCGSPVESSPAFLTVTTAPIIPTFELVTSTAQLEAGAQYIIASSKTAGAAKALSSQNGTSNRRAADVTIVNDNGTLKITTSPETTSSDANDKPYAITFEDAGAGQFYLMDVVNNTYLRPATNSTTNGLLGNAVASAYTVTIDAINSNAVITNVGNPNPGNRNIIRFNSSNNPQLFSSYASGQNPVYLYKSDIVTPIKLHSFKAQKSGSHVVLEWTTASETNNKGFEVERSADGKTWASIASLASKAEGGTSHTALNYTFVDTKPMAKNMYRLKQYDFDGKFEYSPIRNVSLDNNKGAYTIYPNPANNSINIDGLTGNETIKFVDGVGNVVKTANAAQTNINIADLTAGVYQLQIANGATIITQKLVITK
jgi:hypothetical protein